MRKLLNTLYINTPDYYLSLDGESIKISERETLVGRFPLLNFESIVTHGYTGVSPKLMYHCMEHNIPISFMSSTGRFLGRVTGEYRGNVLLRKQQYRWSDDPIMSHRIAQNIVLAKTHNSRWILDRAKRDHSLQIDCSELEGAIQNLKNGILRTEKSVDLEQLRGYEGEAAQTYFSVFDQLILKDKKNFVFQGRNRRPPIDRVNALLSYLYTILMHDVRSALETVGLDPFVGFLHRDRPGRASLALDLMEEFRGVMVDRVVLTAINREEMVASDFIELENGAYTLKEESRKKLLRIWQEKKQARITHPFLDEKINWGLAPYCQALLLSRYIRGDLEAYPPFFYRA